jgi:cation:H+ antiporter
LSVRWGIPTVVIGATVVSLGTTLPETTVSVLAALGGRPELALGNAVGSIICDTGLILGLAILLGRIPLNHAVVNRQGWIQIGSALLLVLLCLPWSAPATALRGGGLLPRWAGWLLLGLLVWYIWCSIRWARTGQALDTVDANPGRGSTAAVFGKLLAGIVLVLTASEILIPTVSEAAIRLRVPQSIIAATLVAFGTSLPELITAITSVRKGHGGLALGNIIGADILNVLFVSGAAAAVTAGGLAAGPEFFTLLFPAMLAILVIFRAAVHFSGDHLPRWAGFLLLGVYLFITLASWFLRESP